jgi:hypothetical protein
MGEEDGLREASDQGRCEDDGDWFKAFPEGLRMRGTFAMFSMRLGELRVLMNACTQPMRSTHDISSQASASIALVAAFLSSAV